MKVFREIRSILNFLNNNGNQCESFEEIAYISRINISKYLCINTQI
jgi:hypothetical protein